MHVTRLGRKQQRGKDFLHDGARGWEGQRRSSRRSHTLALDVGVRNGRQDHVMLPPRIAPTFEVIEAQFALEFLVLLLDGPPLMGQADQRPQRGGGGEWTK